MTLMIAALMDGKIGHERQVLGFIKALKKSRNVKVHELQVSEVTLFGKVNLDGDQTQQFDYVIGAGHSTHLKMVFLAWRYKAKTIVLMNPSLPRFLFNYCIVPAHDGVSPKKNTFISVGALNDMEISVKKHEEALMLLGGKSKEYSWDNEKVFSQIAEIVRTNNRPCVVVGSRRTPVYFWDYVRTHSDKHLSSTRFFPFNDLPHDWLKNNLGNYQWVWVTEDSVNMVYEALTVGAVVGLIEMESSGLGRVHDGIKSLKREGLVNSGNLSNKAFNESERAVRWFLENEK